jgi:hypothetical protein
VTQETKKESAPFQNGREAVVVLPHIKATGKEIVGALGIAPPKALILIVGGADSIDANLKPRLSQLFGRSIARAAFDVGATVIDDGTASGVTEMMGQGVADHGYKCPLIGVAPLSQVNYPVGPGGKNTDLDPNHSHFVLVEGNSWGDELGVVEELVECFTEEARAIAILANGGPRSRKEVLHIVRRDLPLLIVEGSGGLADEIAAAWRARSSQPEPADPEMAEIIADGNIELHGLANSIKGMERQIVRKLGVNQILLTAWERFADYDLNANLQQQSFNQIQKSILIIGLITTTLALVKQVYDPAGIVRVDYYFLLLMPIVLTTLITIASRFKQGNKWLLLRAGAESIKQEIYRYRARAGDYREVLPPPPSPPAPDAVAPPPAPEQILAQRIGDIKTRTMKTDVNMMALKPYDKKKGFPPYMFAAQGGDDGFTFLSPDRYVDVRLGDQLLYFRKTVLRLERQLTYAQYGIFVAGGLGTFLAAVNQQVWIAVTTAVGAALTTYLGYRQTENSLMKYNQTATDLESVMDWWKSLPPDEQAKQESVDNLVEHTEKVLASEMDGWVQQMQSALEQLRKDQASSSKDQSTSSKDQSTSSKDQ